MSSEDVSGWRGTDELQFFLPYKLTGIEASLVWKWCADVNVCCDQPTFLCLTMKNWLCKFRIGAVQTAASLEKKQRIDLSYVTQNVLEHTLV